MDSIFDRIGTLLRGCSTDSSHLPPTYLYNEGWMLRLIMDWFDQAGSTAHGHRLAISPDGEWGSEVLLPTTFKAQHRGDPRAESATHADGVIGHFNLRNGTKRGLELRAEGTQLVILEAKMFSGFSAGTKNAPAFNQAARSVACVAEVLRRAGRSPLKIDILAFHVLAPASQITLGRFDPFLEKNSIRTQVAKRAADYDGTLDAWLASWFLPTMDKIEIRAISWEELIRDITHVDPYGRQLNDFYQHCLESD